MSEGTLNYSRIEARYQEEMQRLANKVNARLGVNTPDSYARAVKIPMPLIIAQAVAEIIQETPN